MSDRAATSFGRHNHLQSFDSFRHLLNCASSLLAKREGRFTQRAAARTTSGTALSSFIWATNAALRTCHFCGSNAPRHRNSVKIPNFAPPPAFASAGERHKVVGCFSGTPHAVTITLCDVCIASEAWWHHFPTLAAKHGPLSFHSSNNDMAPTPSSTSFGGGSTDPQLEYTHQFHAEPRLVNERVARLCQPRATEGAPFLLQPKDSESALVVVVEYEREVAANLTQTNGNWFGTVVLAPHMQSAHSPTSFQIASSMLFAPQSYEQESLYGTTTCVPVLPEHGVVGLILLSPGDIVRDGIRLARKASGLRENLLLQNRHSAAEEVPGNPNNGRRNIVRMPGVELLALVEGGSGVGAATPTINDSAFGPMIVPAAVATSAASAPLLEADLVAFLQLTLPHSLAVLRVDGIAMDASAGAPASPLGPRRRRGFADLASQLPTHTEDGGADASSIPLLAALAASPCRQRIQCLSLPISGDITTNNGFAPHLTAHKLRMWRERLLLEVEHDFALCDFNEDSGEAVVFPSLVHNLFPSFISLRKPPGGVPASALCSFAASPTTTIDDNDDDAWADSLDLQEDRLDHLCDACDANADTTIHTIPRKGSIVNGLGERTTSSSSHDSPVASFKITTRRRDPSPPQPKAAVALFDRARTQTVLIDPMLSPARMLKELVPGPADASSQSASAIATARPSTDGCSVSSPSRPLYGEVRRIISLNLALLDVTLLTRAIAPLCPKLESFTVGRSGHSTVYPLDAVRNSPMADSSSCMGSPNVQGLATPHTSLPKLRELQLFSNRSPSGCEGTNAVLAPFWAALERDAFPSLQRLIVSASSFAPPSSLVAQLGHDAADDSFLAKLCLGFPKVAARLELLSLECSPDLRSLRPLRNCPRLEHLSLRYCSAVDDQSIGEWLSFGGGCDVGGALLSPQQPKQAPRSPMHGPRGFRQQRRRSSGVRSLNSSFSCGSGINLTLNECDDRESMKTVSSPSDETSRSPFRLPTLDQTPNQRTGGDSDDDNFDAPSLPPAPSLTTDGADSTTRRQAPAIRSLLLSSTSIGSQTMRIAASYLPNLELIACDSCPSLQSNAEGSASPHRGAREVAQAFRTLAVAKRTPALIFASDLPPSGAFGPVPPPPPISSAGAAQQHSSISSHRSGGGSHQQLGGLNASIGRRRSFVLRGDAVLDSCE